MTRTFHLRPLIDLKRTALSGAASLLVLAGVFATPATLACDVAAISMSFSDSGRPILWKNRDDSDSFFQGLRYYPASNPAVGGHVCMEEYFWGTGQRICSGGANESGFAVLNASVYRDTMVEEILNVDVVVMKTALEQCNSIQCFEDLLHTWNDGRPDSRDIISSNFVAMDAFGGVAMYEASSSTFGGEVQIVKHDANQVGFANHTNFNRFNDNPGIERRDRATALLEDLHRTGGVNPLNVMQVVAKDVCGDVDDQPANRFPTRLCISRAQTTSAMVIEGVTPGMDPRLTTIWANVGEPSVGVFTPVFPAAQQIPDKLYGTNMGYSELNLEIVAKEHKVYDNNGAMNGLIPSPIMDTHINLDRLAGIQKIVEPIERELDKRTRNFMAQLIANPSTISSQKLAQFQQQSAEYVYQEYVIKQRPWYNRSFSLATVQIMLSGLAALQNSARWAMDMYRNREALLDGTISGGEASLRYLRRQIPVELAALYEAFFK